MGSPIKKLLLITLLLVMSSLSTIAAIDGGSGVHYWRMDIATKTLDEAELCTMNATPGSPFNFDNGIILQGVRVDNDDTKSMFNTSCSTVPTIKTMDFWFQRGTTTSGDVMKLYDVDNEAGDYVMLDVGSSASNLKTQVDGGGESTIEIDSSPGNDIYKHYIISLLDNSSIMVWVNGVRQNHAFADRPQGDWEGIRMAKAKVTVDNVYFSTQIYTQVEADESYNSGSGINHILTAPAPDLPATPSFVSPTPADGDTNRINITINISQPGTDLTYNLYINGTKVLDNVTPTETGHRTYTTTIFTNGNHTYKASVQNTTSGAISLNVTQSYVLDNNIPEFTIDGNNFFKTTNDSIVGTANISSLFINITETDNVDLFARVLNITSAATGLQLYGLINTSLNGKSLRYMDFIDLSNATTGIYTALYELFDSHTAETIPRWRYAFNGAEELYIDEQIVIEAVDATRASAVRRKDRIEFEFQYSKGSTGKREYFVEGTSELQLISTSGVKAHFVDWEHKKWIDFEGTEGSPTVTKVTDKRYKVEFDNLGDSVVFHSVGGLNNITQTYSFTVDTTKPTITFVEPDSQPWDIPVNQSQSIDLTITDNQLVGNVTFYLMNASFAIINTTLQQFSSSNVTPSITYSGLMDQSYFFNLTAHDHYGNSRNSERITLSTTLLDDCTFPGFPTINFTVRNLSTDKQLVADMEFLFDYERTDDAGNLISRNFSNAVKSNSTKYCITPNSTSFIADITGIYTVGGVEYSYSTENTNLSNTTKFVNLYVSSGTEQVTMNVKDLGGNNIEGAIIRILEFDIGTNTFTQVESVSTDVSGNALANLKLLSTLYVFKVEYLGEIKLTDGPTKVLSATKNFRIDISGGNQWKENSGALSLMEGSIVFNNVTKTFTYTYDDTGQSVSGGCLEVIKHNFSKSVVVGGERTCTTGTSGVINVVVGSISKDRYIATGTIELNAIDYILAILEEDFGTTERFFGEDERKVGVFASFMLITAITMIGSFSIPAAITLHIMGFFLAMLFGFQIGTQAMVTLVILGGILIYRVNSA